MKYDIGYADPAWQYRNDAPGVRGLAQTHYSTLSLAQIKGMPVGDLMAKDAVLFLWATYPLLDVGIDVLKAWGFTYKTVAFTWVKIGASGKPSFGCGSWTRANPELVLLGVRGKMKRVDAGVPNLLMAPRMRHSAKPPEIRDRIVRLMGDRPRLELFARDHTPGWHVWGNEVTSNVQIDIP